MVYRAYVTKGGAGNSDPSGTLGELVPDNGSKRGISLQSTHTGDIYNVGLQEVAAGYVGRPYQYMTTDGLADGRLFETYPGSGGMSGPFHGMGDTLSREMIPPLPYLDYMWQRYYSNIPQEEGLASFAYDWKKATFGGSNLFEMLRADIRKKWPGNGVPVGGQISISFNVVADFPSYSYWRIWAEVSFAATYRGSPYYDDVAYEDGALDYVKPEAIENLAAIDQVNIGLSVYRSSPYVNGRVDIARIGVGFGDTGDSRYYEPGVSGFAQLGVPDIRLFVLPDGLVTLATNSKAATTTLANNLYTNGSTWPLLKWDVNSGWMTVDELNPHGMGGRRRWYRRKGGYCFG